MTFIELAYYCMVWLAHWPRGHSWELSNNDLRIHLGKICWSRQEADEYLKLFKVLSYWLFNLILITTIWNGPLSAYQHLPYTNIRAQDCEDVFHNQSNCLTYGCQKGTLSQPLWLLAQQISLTLKIRHNFHFLMCPQDLWSLCKCGIGSFTRERTIAWHLLCANSCFCCTGRKSMYFMFCSTYYTSHVFILCIFSLSKYEISITEPLWQEVISLD